MATAKVEVAIKGDGSQAIQSIDQVQDALNQVFGKDYSGLLTKGLKGLSLAFIAKEAMDIGRAVVESSDKFALMQSRINLINDGQKTTKELLTDIHAAANRSRGSYEDMANVVGKLGILAKDAFSNNQEMVFFAEQMNKQFKIGGASIQEQTAAMYQLTQAMAAGRLQGDEFRSIRENAPMLAQAIATEMGVPIGKLREMSSEGKITAEVIKNAMIHSAEATNEQFSQLPMTFSDMVTQLQNDALLAFQPLLDAISEVGNSEEMQTMMEGISAGLRVAGAVATATFGVIKTAMNGVIAVAKVMGSAVVSAFSVLRGMLPAVVGLLAGYVVYMNMARIQTALNTAAMVLWRVAVIACQGSMLALDVAIKGVALALGAKNVAMRASQGIVAAYRTVIFATNGLLAIFRARSLAAAAASGIQAGAQAVLNAVMMVNPIPLIIGLLGALAGAFGVASLAGGDLGATLSNVWSSLVHTTAWAINQIIDLINSMIRALNAVGQKLASTFKFEFSEISELKNISADAAEEFVQAGNKFASTVAKSFDMANIEAPEMTASGGGGVGGDSSGGGGSGGSGGGGGASKADELLRKAEEIHKAIEDEWANLFMTKTALADRWYAEELEKLNESRAVNANYQEDLTKLTEIHTKKRIDAMYEEAAAARDVMQKVRDMRLAMFGDVTMPNVNGADGVWANLAVEAQNAFNAIEDRYAGYADTFGKLTEQQKQMFLASLKEQGIAYELSTEGMINFDKAKYDALLGLQKTYQEKAQDIVLNGEAVKAEIKEAMRTLDHERFKTALESEEMALAESYARQQELYNQYLEARKEAEMSWNEMMHQSMMTAANEVGNSISGLLKGTMTLADAFKNVGKAFLNMMADMVAKKIASSLKMSLLDKQLTNAQTKLSIAAATAQYPAWAKLALVKSMATSGMSAELGTAAFSSGLAAGMTAIAGANIPGFADGAIVSGPTLAMVGEGRYAEAVVPINETNLGAIGEGAMNALGNNNGTVHVHVSAVDAESFSSWLDRTGGKAFRQFALDSIREFTNEVGVW